MCIRYAWETKICIITIVAGLQKLMQHDILYIEVLECKHERGCASRPSEQKQGCGHVIANTLIYYMTGCLTPRRFGTRKELLLQTDIIRVLDLRIVFGLLYTSYG